MKSLNQIMNEKLMITSRVDKKEMKLIQRAIYKELEKNNTTCKYYRDTNWAGVTKVKEDIMNALHGLYNKTKHDYDCSIAPINGGYRQSSDGMAQWKEYEIALYLGKKEEPFMKGSLNCHAAGSAEDPFDMYDMSVMLYV